MSVGDGVARDSKAIIDGHINLRRMPHVPEPAEISLKKNEGIEVDATYLYADMVNSSGLAQYAYKPVTAKIIRSYINGASSLIRHCGGEIRSFDGDRVMGIFMGTDKETRAVRAAFAINWLVQQELSVKIAEKWEDIAKFWRLDHSIGIDTGESVITKAGVWGDNDIVSIGKAPNVAAKLSDLRHSYYKLHITHEVYGPMSNDVAFAGDGQQMWQSEGTITVGKRAVQVLGSGWTWGL